MTPSTDRGLSPAVKFLLYGALGLLALWVTLRVVGLVLGLAFGLVAALVGLAVTAAVLLGVGYVAYWAISSLLSGDESDETAATSRQADDRDPVERARERYANGELTDAEFEREIERALRDDAAPTDTDVESELG